MLCIVLIYCECKEACLQEQTPFCFGFTHWVKGADTFSGLCFTHWVKSADTYSSFFSPRGDTKAGKGVHSCRLEEILLWLNLLWVSLFMDKSTGCQFANQSSLHLLTYACPNGTKPKQLSFSKYWQLK